MNLAVGKKSDQREITQHAMDKTGFFRMVAELFLATAQAGDVEQSNGRENKAK